MRPDFPYYNGWPVTVDGTGWATLLAAVAVGFAALISLPFQGFPLQIIPALLFVGIPLAALRLVAGRHWLALFGPVGLREIGLMVLFGIATLAGSMVTGWLLSMLFELSANPVSVEMESYSAADLVERLVPTIPQLVGEELLTILPFLAILWVCVSKLGLSRGAGIAIALVLSSLIFGAAHIQTYSWNWPQALVGLGLVRVLLTLAYVVTRNLWVSAGAHILNDWTGFILLFAFGGGAVEG